MRLRPDLPVVYSPDDAAKVATRAVKYRERGVVGLGVAPLVDVAGAEPFARAFAIARDGGLAADRIRQGIRADEDRALVAELAGRGTVLDVCPLSNLRLGIVGSLDEHPLPRLVAAGVHCSISTDDPALLDTDLNRDYQAATSLGLEPRSLYDAGVAGALCDDKTRERLRAIGSQYDWRSATAALGGAR